MRYISCCLILLAVVSVARADTTGTILFTAVEPMHVRSTEWMIGAARAHREAQGEAAAKAAKVLAGRAIHETEALVRFAESFAQEKSKVRLIPSPVQALTPVAAP